MIRPVVFQQMEWKNATRATDGSGLTQVKEVDTYFYLLSGSYLFLTPHQSLNLDNTETIDKIWKQSSSFDTRADNNKSTLPVSSDISAARRRS